MRFKITLNRTGKQRMLPMDYQYYLSAWIYKVISKANYEFANFLHSEGYGTGGRRFKLFCYSPLDFGKPVLWKEKSLFEIKTDQLTVNVSFQLDEAAENFIIGLFNHQQAYIGDRFNGLELAVTQVERLSDPTMEKTMHYRALSPIVISRLTDGEKYARYLSPATVGYAGLLRAHIEHKYTTVPQATPLPEVFDFDFSLQGNPRSKLITLKAYTPQQSKVRGYVYEFQLTAPVKIHRLLLAAGAGEKNSMGFGWCEIIKLVLPSD